MLQTTTVTGSSLVAGPKSLVSSSLRNRDKIHGVTGDASRPVNLSRGQSFTTSTCPNNS